MFAKTVMLFLAASVTNTGCCDGSRIGTCEPSHKAACEAAHLDCKLSVPVTEKGGICGCAAIFYAICLPTAGCAAADSTASCINELMQWDCPDMSVCGNDCTLEDNDPLIPEDSILLPVNNFGANYIQLSVCSRGVSTRRLEHFGQISLEACAEEDFRVCELWIAPRTLTAVAFPPDVTRLRVEYCVITIASEEPDGTREEEAWECLGEPLPMDYYGTTAFFAVTTGMDAGPSSVSHWPSSVDVDYLSAVLCEKDTHCPGSFCDFQQQPKICAPKVGEHFRESGSHFLDPRWEILNIPASNGY